MVRAAMSLLILIGAGTARAMDIKSVRVSRATHSRPTHVKMTITPSDSLRSAELDLLFVVDNSASMSPYQQMLADQADQIATALQEFSSLNMAVTTSSMNCLNCASGRFVGQPPVLSATNPDFKRLLAANLLVGSDGSSVEEFFTPVMAALSPPLVDSANAGFLRPNAHLAVVLVTDADDQTNVSPSQFVDFLKTLKGDRGFSLNAFVTSPKWPNCPGQISSTPPVHLEQAVALAHGETYSLCEKEYARHIQEVGHSIGRVLARTLNLPLPPKLSSLTVKFGSLVLEPGDIHNGWIYNSVNNTLILGDQINWNTLPDESLEIEFDGQI